MGLSVMSKTALSGPKLVAAATLAVAVAIFTAPGPSRAATSDAASVGSLVQTAQNAASPGQAGSYTVYFPLDSDILSADAEAVIDQAVAAAGQAGRGAATVYGYTDRNGSQQYNSWLAQRRANQVKDAMVFRGLSAESIKIMTPGEADPAVPTADGAVEQANRRVVIVFE